MSEVGTDVTGSSEEQHIFATCCLLQTTGHCVGLSSLQNEDKSNQKRSVGEANEANDKERIMKSVMRNTAFSLAGAAAALWLLQRSKRLHELIELSPKWRNDDGRSYSPSELELDDTIAASFPASDPPSSTPIVGTGQRMCEYPFAK